MLRSSFSASHPITESISVQGQSLATRLALANPLTVLLNKDKRDFTRADMLRAIKHFGVERITFHYSGLDGHLKELRLPFSDTSVADRILAMGERVDGSSLFPGVVDTGVSDLYVVPRYKTAFLNPFDLKSLDFVCRFIDSDGHLAGFPPDNVLQMAHERLTARTGLTLQALGELEFYLVSPQPAADYYPPDHQGGYHNSAPFFKHGPIIDEIVHHLQQTIGCLKYAHAEVGFIPCLVSENPLLDGHRAEQYEVEMRTEPIEDMGDYLTVARWIIRNVAYRHGLLATFAPKLAEGVAGTGMHIHLELIKDGVNQMLDPEGTLSNTALQLIGGLTKYAPTLSAFGNTVAASFLRLVPNQEAPTKICWSHSNRSSLIRVPLGWRQLSDLASVVNPQETQHYKTQRGYQTVELRSPDGSAQTYLLLAGMATAAEWGLTNDNSVALAKNAMVRGNIFRNKELADKLEPLPKSCVDCAKELQANRAMYDSFGVIPPLVLDYIIDLLNKEDDENLNVSLKAMPEEERMKNTLRVMHRDLNRH